MRDSPLHQGKRRLLVADLQRKGISQASVLTAINAVPRHVFMDSGFLEHAYVDKAFPIAANQTISQPFTVARQTELLAVQPGHKLLEVGTGSGYQTAVLLELGATVYTIERQHVLFKNAKRNLQALGYKPKKCIYGDGYLGWKEAAPYNGILVTAGAPKLPETLLAQLAIGGKLVVPIGETEQKMTVFTRQTATHFEKKVYGNFKFVPLLKHKA